jgi:hypothetical protein
MSEGSDPSQGIIRHRPSAQCASGDLCAPLSMHAHVLSPSQKRNIAYRGVSGGSDPSQCIIRHRRKAQFASGDLCLKVVPIPITHLTPPSVNAHVLSPSQKCNIAYPGVSGGSDPSQYIITHRRSAHCASGDLCAKV